jgi:hypothetical protein
VARKPKASRPAASPKRGSKGGPGDGAKSQRERFIKTAREVGVDETGDEFMRLLRKVVSPKKRATERQ